ncbi:unnamed protein product [Spodoptera exigua]|nr:unnamed protein product [Spodoptera exigua]
MFIPCKPPATLLMLMVYEIGRHILRSVITARAYVSHQFCVSDSELRTRYFIALALTTLDVIVLIQIFNNVLSFNDDHGAKSSIEFSHHAGSDEVTHSCVPSYGLSTPLTYSLGNYHEELDLLFLTIATKVVEKQFESDEIKSFINNNETFDLLLLETWIRPTLFWTYVYDVPVISVSSFGSLYNDYVNMGGPIHPLLHPTSLQRDVWNENFWQKILALKEYWKLDSMFNELEIEEDALAKKLFGEVPPLKEQIKKIELLVLNVHPAWQEARPVPQNVVHLGATHLQDENQTMHISPQLEEYLELSTAGVVYISQDKNIGTSILPEHLKRKLIRAFSKLSCPVLWNCDEDIKDLPHNVKLGKWFPQAALLNHPNINLFISQCGQQSIDEAIASSVPVLGLPQTEDQWRNAELLVHHEVGATVDLETISDEELRNIIEDTMKNERISQFLSSDIYRTTLTTAPITCKILHRGIPKSSHRN